MISQAHSPAHLEEDMTVKDGVMTLHPAWSDEEVNAEVTLIHGEIANDLSGA